LVAAFLTKRSGQLLRRAINCTNEESHRLPEGLHAIFVGIKVKDAHHDSQAVGIGPDGQRLFNR